MTTCFFASDMHGRVDRYRKLFQAIEDECPDAVFLGGDLLPSAVMMLSPGGSDHEDFVSDYLVKELEQLREKVGDGFPRLFLILGNDDGRSVEAEIEDVAATGLWEYVHDRKVDFENYSVFGYSFVPPTPFLMKDWEKYDVSRYVDPGCVSPEEGLRSVPVPADARKYSSIEKDLDSLAGENDLAKAIFLFHAPPYQTRLDRAALDGKKIDHVPLDVHVGSIAIQRFIKNRQPLLTLHGHVHESSRLTGSWRDCLGRTHMFSAAHDGPELALIRFDPENLEKATRELL